MRSVIMTILLVLTVITITAHATDTTQPKVTRTNPAAMSDAQRRNLERRIDALERQHEMRYRETGSPTGAPGAAPAPAESPAARAAAP